MERPVLVIKTDLLTQDILQWPRLQFDASPERISFRYANGQEHTAVELGPWGVERVLEVGSLEALRACLTLAAVFMRRRRQLYTCIHMTPETELCLQSK